MKLLPLLLICLLPAAAFAVTQQDCTNQLANCIQRTCIQAGCQLDGDECYCTDAEEARWDALTDQQCEEPYISCIQQAYGGSTGGSDGGCCGGGFVLLGGAALALVFASRK